MRALGRRDGSSEVAERGWDARDAGVRAGVPGRPHHGGSCLGGIGFLFTVFIEPAAARLARPPSR
jgi:hypothetical protein